MAGLTFRIGRRLVDLEARTVDTDGEKSSLTPQEVALLQALATASKHTCSRADLYREVWGYRSMPQGRALHYAVRRLRSKIEDNPDKAVFLMTVRGFGYRLDGLQMEAKVPAETQDDGYRVHPVPRYTERYIPRPGEREEMQALLSRERAVTLIGFGGIGKTRLAVEVAINTGWKVAFCDVVGVEDDSTLHKRIAAALGLNRVPDGTGDALDMWMDQSCQLLIIDGADGGVTGLARWMEGWVERLKKTRILVTSRKPLRFAGEWVYQVKPLPLAQAAALFEDRVRRHGGQTTGLDAVLPQLEGVPLILELAAPQTALLGANAMAEHFARRGNILHAADPSRPERHQTIANLVTQSLDGLDSQWHPMLSGLVILQEGFSLEQLEVLAGENAYQMLSQLVETSLAHAIEGAQPVRWRLPLYVSGFIRRTMQPALEEVWLKWAAHFAAPERGPLIGEAKSEDAWLLLVHDLESIRAVWNWSAKHPDRPCFNRLGWVLAHGYAVIGMGIDECEVLKSTWDVMDPEDAHWELYGMRWAARGRLTPKRGVAMALLEQLATTAKNPVVAVRCILFMAVDSFRAGHIEKGERWATLGLQRAQEEGFTGEVGEFHLLMAEFALVANCTVDAVAALDAAEKCARLQERLQLLSRVLSLQARMAMMSGEMLKSRGFLQEALALAKTSDNYDLTLVCRGNLALLDFECGLWGTPIEEIRRGYEVRGSMENALLTYAHEVKCFLAAGKMEEAQACVQIGLARAQRLQLPQPLTLLLFRAAEVAMARGFWEDAAVHLDALWSRLDALQSRADQLMARIALCRAAHHMGKPPRFSLDELEALEIHCTGAANKARAFVAKAGYLKDIGDVVGRDAAMDQARECMRDYGTALPLDLVGLA